VSPCEKGKKYRQRWGVPEPVFKDVPADVQAVRERFAPAKCKYLGKPIGKTDLCQTCTGKIPLELLACALHGSCHETRTPANGRNCHVCPDRVNRDLIEVVITADGIGDHILGLTIAAGVKKQDPSREVVYVCNGRAFGGDAKLWVELFGGYDRLSSRPVHKPTRSIRPHDTYGEQMRRRDRSRLEIYARVAGCPLVLPEVKPLPEAATRWAEQYRGAILLSPWISNEDWKIRMWPKGHWIELVRLLKEAGYRPVVLDSHPKRSDVFECEVIQRQPPAMVAAAIQGAACLIGNDSGMVHAAGMLRTPALVLTGYIAGEQIFGVYPSVKVLNGHLPCGNCHGQGWAGWRPECDTACANLATVTPAEVLAAVKGLTPQAGLPAVRTVDPASRVLQVHSAFPGIGDSAAVLLCAAGLKRDHPHKEVILSVHRHAHAWMELFEGYDQLHSHTELCPADQTFAPCFNSESRSEGKTRAEVPHWMSLAAGHCGTTATLPALRPLPLEARQWAESYRGCVVLAPFAANSLRSWSLSHWLTLESMLLQEGLPVVVLYGEAVNGVNSTAMSRTAAFRSPVLRSEFPVRIAALMLGARCVVGNDSGMVHIAGLLGVVGLVLCGPYDGRQLYGNYPTIHVLQGPLFCSGCMLENWPREKISRTLIGCDGPSCQAMGCRSKYEHAASCAASCSSLQAITPDEVLHEILGVTASSLRSAILSAPGDFRIWPFFREGDPMLHMGRERIDGIYRINRQIAATVKPRAILEIGVRAGYSACAFLSAVPEANYLGLDNDGGMHGGIRGYVASTADRLREAFPRAKAEIRILDSQDARARISLLSEFRGAFDFVHVDGDHTDAGCYSDMAFAVELLSNGGWLLVDDYDLIPDVRRAVDRFAEQRRLKGIYLPSPHGDMLFRCEGVPGA